MQDELGAHVSSAGGCPNAPARAGEIGAAVLQLFTKTPNMWREPEIDAATGEAFRRAREEHGVRTAVSHDSYLINLASHDPALFARSYDSFARELRRCATLGIELLVTHPGNATDGEMERGIVQNAAAIARALQEEGGETTVLVETTCGAGKVLGCSFGDLARILDMIPDPVRDRVAVCVDTCHVWAAGYDLRDDYEGVVAELAATVGLENVRLFHLNDSQFERGTKRDRHAWIGDGCLGEEPFRRLVRDPRFAHVPKVLETPKGDDHAAADRENLRRLRGYREEA